VICGHLSITVVTLYSFLLILFCEQHLKTKIIIIIVYRYFWGLIRGTQIQFKFFISLCEEKEFFLGFLSWTSELRITQAFCEHQARQIPTMYEPVANSCEPVANSC
jgi:hypothetical protein